MHAVARPLDQHLVLALLKQVGANLTFALQYLRSKESAEYLEYYDTLTGLPNGFTPRLSKPR